MGKSTDAWFIIDGEAAPTDDVGNDGHQDGRSRFRRALLGLGIGVFLFAAFVGLMAVTAPAHGTPMVVVSPPAAVVNAAPSPTAPAVAAIAATPTKHKAIARKHHRRR